MPEEKNLACNSSVSSKEPYVRYRVSADIVDKGVGFALQQTLKTYLDNHGYDSTISVLNRSSDRFEAIINLFDNGNYDFNMTAFLEHIENSGRMPTKASANPKVDISPLPCSGLELTLESHNETPKEDIVWQKAIDCLCNEKDEMREHYEKQLASSETTIEGLNNALSQRTAVISDKDKELKELRKAADKKVPVVYSNPISALLHSYASQFQEPIFGAAYDLRLLKEAGVDLPSFNEFRKKENGNFVDYVNWKLNTNFESEDELNAWIELMDNPDSWKEVPEVKEFREKLGILKKDEDALRTVESLEVSEEVVSAMREAIEKKRNSYKTFGNSVSLIEYQFNKDKEKADLLNGSNFRKSYELVLEAKKNIEERVRTQQHVPIVTQFNSEFLGGDINMFVPSIEPESGFEKIIGFNLAGFVSTFPDMDFGSDANQIENFIVYSAKPTKNCAVSRARDIANDLIRKNKFNLESIFSSLGLNLTPVVLRE